MPSFTFTRALYQSALRPLLFTVDAETIHERATVPLRLAQSIAPARAMLRALYGAPEREALAVEAFGKRLRTPIGVAAGFDKNGLFYNALGALGFSFVEVGTVTAHAQPGNERPRLFRLPADRAIVNRMGFNNDGATAVAARISRKPARDVVLGINLGKSKLTPLEDAASDYEFSARVLAPLAEYIVLNVSSPNTPGLRSLQSVDALRGIIRGVRAACGASAPSVLVKIAPDLADDDVDAVADLAWDERLAGVIATNTTVSREGLTTAPELVAAAGLGGLSGAPLRARSTEVIGRVYRRTGGRVMIIGVGGVTTADDVWAKMRAGATLVQVYTSFVYEGPTLAGDLARGLLARMKRERVARIRDLVGAAHR